MTSYFNKWNKYDIIEENGVITYVSDFFCRLTEYNAQDLIGMTAEKLFYEILRAVMRTANLDDGTEAILFAKDLTAINVIIQRTISEQTTRIQYIVIETPHSSFEDRYPYIHQLCRSNVVGVAVYSVPDMILIKANEKYFSFLEPPFHRKANSIGMKIDEIITGWSGSPVEQYWREAVNTHKVVQVQEYEHTGYSTGLTYWDSILTPIEENGVVKYVVSNTFNVTERVTARKQMEEKNKLIDMRNRQLEAIIDNCSDGMYLFDKDGNYIYQNKTATDYTNGRLYRSIFDFIKDYQYSDIHGKTIPCSSIPAVQVLNGIKVNNQVVTKTTPFGRAYYDVCGTPIPDEEGNVCCGVIYIRDMTNYILQSETIQKQNEELEVMMNSQFELREAKEKLLKLEYEKNEVLINAIKQKDEFLYLITHEFKTPLTVIMSALQTMDMVCSNQIPDKAGKYINKIKQNVYRQLRLVGNLLDVTRLNSGFTNLNSNVYDIVHLTRSIVESIRSIAQQKEIQISFSTRLSKHEILVDEQKFERILLNLLSNALKFTRKNKFINVTLDQAVYHKEKMISVSVQDSGIGIPKEKQKFIFERFGQVNTNLSRQAEGTGIGLYLVKLMANAMGGYITLDSEEGKGSTFTILLPDIKSQDMAASSSDEEEQLIKRDERLTSEIEIQLSDIYD